MGREQDGLASTEDIYPISDALVERLVDMMTAFLFAQLEAAPPRKC